MHWDLNKSSKLTTCQKYSRCCVYYISELWLLHCFSPALSLTTSDGKNCRLKFSRWMLKHLVHDFCVPPTRLRRSAVWCNCIFLHTAVSKQIFWPTLYFVNAAFQVKNLHFSNNIQTFRMILRALHRSFKVQKSVLKRGFSSGGAPATKTEHGWIGEQMKY